jgi:anti-sigma regulatory factor (Ser/Thr protein kinase)
VTVSDAGVDARLQGRNAADLLGGRRPMDELALHILDIALNSYQAGATSVGISVLEAPELDRLTIEIRDNGRGMDQQTQARAFDPCFTTRQTRRGGLGLPLLRQAAEAAGGRLLVRSTPGEGTLVIAELQLNHAGRAPLGDLETTFMVLTTSRPDVELILTHRRGTDGYEVSSADLTEALGGLPLTGPEGLALTRQAIRRCEARLASCASATPAGDRPGMTTREADHD